MLGDLQHSLDVAEPEGVVRIDENPFRVRAFASRRPGHTQAVVCASEFRGGAARPLSQVLVVDGVADRIAAFVPRTKGANRCQRVLQALPKKGSTPTEPVAVAHDSRKITLKSCPVRAASSHTQ